MCPTLLSPGMSDYVLMVKKQGTSQLIPPMELSNYQIQGQCPFFYLSICSKSIFRRASPGKDGYRRRGELSHDVILMTAISESLSDGTL